VNPPPTFQRTDFAVIGGGIIGLSCLLHVLDAEPGLSAVVLDAPSKPGVASRAAAGMLAPLAEFDEDSPLFRLCVESFDYYPQFLSRFAPDGPRVEETGILVPASDTSAERAERIAAFAASYADPQFLDGAALVVAEPALAGGRVRRALRLPGAIINPRQLHDALHAEALRRGVQFITRPLKAVEFEDERLVGLLLDDETTIRPRRALLATGAWSHHIGELFGLHLQVVPIRGQVARTHAPDTLLRHIVHEHAIYLAPRRGHGVVIGATMENVGFSEAVDRQTTADLYAAAVAIVPELARYTVMESWIGFRPKLGDGSPLIGWAPSAENLLIAIGHYRNGILLAPITGQRIADLWCAGASRA
jgi:glycine oxidase